MKIHIIADNDPIPAILESYGITADEAESIFERIKYGYAPKSHPRTVNLPRGAEVHYYGRLDSFMLPVLYVITMFLEGGEKRELALVYSDRSELVFHEDEE